MARAKAAKVDLANLKTLDELKEDFRIKAKKDGSVAQKDIFEMTKHLDLNEDALDDLLQWFNDENINVVSEEEEVEVTEEMMSKDTDDDDLVGDDIDDDDSNEEFDMNLLDPTIAETANVKVNDPVKMYLKEIGRVQLLKPEEEPIIAQQIQSGEDAKEKLKKDAELHSLLEADVKEGEEAEEKLANPAALEGLSEDDIADLKEASRAGLSAKMKLENGSEDFLTEDEKNELERINAIGEEAKNKLISSNLRLVVSIAKKYVGRGMLFLDLIQEGNMGLVKAVEKFDYTKGFKFSTYATWWIRQAITRAIADQARTIRIPVHMVETINKLTRIQRQLTQELGREPTAEEISKQMDGVTPEKVREIQKIAMEPVSLETPIGEEDDSHLGDFIEDKEALSPDEYANNQLLKDEINMVLQGLTEREEKVLRLRFGLYDGKTRTLEEVGKEFNVTRERIRQIEAKALRKLKHPTRSKRLRDFVDKN